MENNFVIKKIHHFDEKALSDLNTLLLQWSNKKNYQISPEYFKVLIKQSDVLVLYDGNDIIGTVTLIGMHKLSGLKGSVEHLLVSEKYRGKGLGKKLMHCAIDLAKKSGIERLFLTCEPEREAANALYQKLGFKIKETNFYYLDVM